MAKLNRRPQFMFFSSIMSAAMFIFGVALMLIGQARASTHAGLLLVGSLFVGTVAYGAGVGSIPYTMVGEVFTPDYKTLGACMVQSVRCITVFSFIKAVPTLVQYIGIHGIFIVHGCVLVFSVVFAWIFLPETKGKTLTELCTIFNK